MREKGAEQSSVRVSSLDDFAKMVDYSLMDTLTCDPDATADGEDHSPREVFSGHYVPVKPTPITDPIYVTHSQTFFQELGLEDQLAQTEDFKRLFAGEVSQVPEPMRPTGWATGYALSIFGTEYTQQCPFLTGNGYGDGRAVSIFEGVINGQRWEMQLKGGGRTPYCRGGDGRAVLRSSIREFLAQEHMQALGVPTSRSLSLYVSGSECVDRPWYSDGSYAFNPDILVSNPVAISTRVAPSFIRVGQLELFGRRVRQQDHPNAWNELQQIVLHAAKREYPDSIDTGLALPEILLRLAVEFRDRLTTLIAEWLRVGYCQGNFNSDNCAVGGFTLDYGPFGFCERFDPQFQPWTGGGDHFSFFNQPKAAEVNFHMFLRSLEPLLAEYPDYLARLDDIRKGFTSVMREKLEKMWAKKLGMLEFNLDLFKDLMNLMIETEVDYTIFFRELSEVPEGLLDLKQSFYKKTTDTLDQKWSEWLNRWRAEAINEQSVDTVKQRMKAVNPKYTWREWLVAPAYQQAMKGDYQLVHELQEVLSKPYEEQSKAVEDKYYRLMPDAFSGLGGVAHYSCSS